ncbi:MAG: DUF493 family protein [Spirochaetales bacterium]|nr:DUF493 family protein [Spirochaetales bacterium]
MKDGGEAVSEGAGIELIFPQSFELKTVFIDSEKTAAHGENLVNLLARLSLVHGNYRARPSAKGSYVALSIPVRLPDRLSFDALYRELKTLPDLKWAM